MVQHSSCWNTHHHRRVRGGVVVRLPTPAAFRINGRSNSVSASTRAHGSFSRKSATMSRKAGLYDPDSAG